MRGKMQALHGTGSEVDTSSRRRGTGPQGNDEATGSGSVRKCMNGRELHNFIRRCIERRLGQHSWSWLAREAGVPRSTLITQAARPKFSVEILVRVAGALHMEVTDLLPPDDSGGTT